jgi:hypothetical protein
MANGRTHDGFLLRTFGYNENSKSYRRYGLYLILVAGAGVAFLSCGEDNVDPQPTPTTTTSTTIPETTTTTIEAPPTTVTPSPEKFLFKVAGIAYDCTVVEEPHVVQPGEHIWKIVDTQAMPEGMPQRWLGTIDLNQIKGTVGDNPNLIYPGDQIYTLVDCITSDALPGTS